MNKAFPVRQSPYLSQRAQLGGVEEIELAPDQIAPGVMIGRAARYFDLSIFMICAAFVFPRLFFPQFNTTIGLAFAFAVFGVAFVVSPIGAALFSGVERRYGRGVKLTSAVFLLCAATALIGLAPGHDAIGPASIGLLVLLRVGQGLALGGIGDGSAAMLALGPPVRRRFFSLAGPLGALAGILCAAALMAYFASGISDVEFVAWGWRYPFIVALAVNVVGLFARMRLMPSERLGAVYARAGVRPGI